MLRLIRKKRRVNPLHPYFGEWACSATMVLMLCGSAAQVLLCESVMSTPQDLNNTFSNGIHS